MEPFSALFVWDARELYEMASLKNATMQRPFSSRAEYPICRRILEYGPIITPSQARGSDRMSFGLCTRKCRQRYGHLGNSQQTPEDTRPVLKPDDHAMVGYRECWYEVEGDEHVSPIHRSQVVWLLRACIRSWFAIYWAEVFEAYSVFVLWIPSIIRSTDKTTFRA
ncbi:hypothetical protein BKA70DRAFT_726629 [Coprinopsis sp. MPI-PUGE-AT-0042]|nr:hypothetical protein BKA70DRAFT_726629 [Coprinopsis sp. MPI-PUGE-AT-0042]